MITVDSWPKTLPMLSAWSWNSTTETHLTYMHTKVMKVGSVKLWIGVIRSSMYYVSKIDIFRVFMTKGLFCLHHQFLSNWCLAPSLDQFLNISCYSEFLFIPSFRDHFQAMTSKKPANLFKGWNKKASKKVKKNIYFVLFFENN